MVFCLKTVLLMAVVYIEPVFCLEVLPERSYISYIDKDYIKWATFKTQRYSRRGKYYIHIDGEILYSFGNNVSMHVIFNEYLHNEYRRSFIEMHYKFCDLINTEPYIGGLLKYAGVVCPVPPGVVHLRNMTTSVQHFPNVFPFEKGRIDIYLNLTSSGLPLMTAHLVCAFKQ